MIMKGEKKDFFFFPFYSAATAVAVEKNRKYAGNVIIEEQWSLRACDTGIVTLLQWFRGGDLRKRLYISALGTTLIYPRRDAGV